ncbi:MAG: hypothetical protein UY13_C0002G0167 [Candidatus Pacebacteria bacterium GW2011_GWB1_47_8]|nr:MAG: hypothetical protein UX28_C0001G0316 [Candidatus Pacebacteria bacterium GW2011_GWA1_46_10]KKU84255.1 MAG: hypothetical protein UY13_C0002G0167 [Candidatus Pacebacteria bacterium GW2011_GWB1_47_8]HCR81475.1 hypothetical protein [Candidatus Paceibacterota bacterium]
MLHYFTHHYDSLAIILPKSYWYRRALLTVRSWVSVIFQRLVVCALLFFDFFPFKVEFENKKLVDAAIRQGAVLLTVHSGPYPVFSKVFERFYPDKELAVTFYHARKVSFFPLFRRFFRRMGVTVIALGGAMREIDPVLTNGGSMVLFLDAKLPISRTERVWLFGKERQLSTGPYFLAKKYGLKVLPLYVSRKGLTLSIHTLPAIPHARQTQQRFMQQVAMAVEQMIINTLPSWQAFDRFLLD